MPLLTPFYSNSGLFAESLEVHSVYLLVQLFDDLRTTCSFLRNGIGFVLNLYWDWFDLLCRYWLCWWEIVDVDSDPFFVWRDGSSPFASFDKNEEDFQKLKEDSLPRQRDGWNNEFLELLFRSSGIAQRGKGVAFQPRILSYHFYCRWVSLFFADLPCRAPLAPFIRYRYWIIIGVDDMPDVDGEWKKS